MSAITIKLSPPTCGHLSFSVTGDKTLTVGALLDDLSKPITDEDAIAFLKVIIRMAKAGSTLNQAKTLLQNGVTVTV